MAFFGLFTHGINRRIEAINNRCYQETGAYAALRADVGNIKDTLEYLRGRFDEIIAFQKQGNRNPGSTAS